MTGEIKMEADQYIPAGSMVVTDSVPVYYKEPIPLQFKTVVRLAIFTDRENELIPAWYSGNS